MHSKALAHGEMSSECYDVLTVEKGGEWFNVTKYYQITCIANEFMFVWNLSGR